MYKAILFDLDQTLLDYNASEFESMQNTIMHHRLFELAGFEEERFRSMYAPINWTYWSERTERKLHISQVLNYSFRDTLVQMGHDDTLSIDLAETYWEFFCSNCHLMDGTQGLLSALHGRYPLGVISNGVGEAQRRRLLAGGLSHYFDHLFISDEVDCRKPERQIFDLAIQALGVDRQQVLFVGDSLTDDYAGARNAEIDFCYFNPGRGSVDPTIQPTFIIHSLSELNALLAMKKNE
ncbi:YjjG family noncanonical pyrimidine nucleotidase [Paenibacillus lignilyticus]|uniref:YjjG family noncanonical pyrimidine nucleotidase n=1 Tax=Paenibacillus lignilyticus TaxID=1172615 RepID=A0ABS5C5M8_9BACL|nr:YjjG family noncanonical pyrimidine nucleotidase [Paenibacillus lignilyticus]MBP3961306.1 YjjG family noncanonical pyrimidine nucleotidase [Paenibacillus lignilyticus]